MKMKKLPAAALFDLDGVLVDSETIYTDIWTEISRTYPTGVENMALKIKGMTLSQILSQYYPDESVRDSVRALLSLREQEMEYRLFPGVDDFLRQLDDAGVPAVVVTSSNDDKMRRLAGQQPALMKHFRALVTDSCVTRSKPDPEPYIVGARAVNVAPSRCIVFEDSFSGMQSGRAAGAAVVGLATTNSRESIAGRADVVLDSFEGLKIEALLEALSEAGRSF